MVIASLFHDELLVAFIVVDWCAVVLAFCLASMIRVNRRLRAELDLVWHEYEVACGTVER